MPDNKMDAPSIQAAMDIDRIIHEPARLMILSVLVLVESADFLFIMKQTGLTRGNLSSHMSKLEETGYIEVKKEFVKKIPRTLLSLTETGEKAYHTYREQMRQLLET